MSPKRKKVNPENLGNELNKLVSSIEAAVMEAIEEVMNYGRDKVIDRTPVGDPKTDIHSGQLKYLGWGPVERTGYSFSFSTNVDYAVILEKGMYKNVGPRTVSFEGGIYSSQAPGGIVAPIIDNPAFKAYLDETIKKKIMQVRNQNA